jgi:hypothetical protein
MIAAAGGDTVGSGVTATVVGGVVGGRGTPAAVLRELHAHVIA